jgi:TP901 family phage tail tape measure protein
MPGTFIDFIFRGRGAEKIKKDLSSIGGSAKGAGKMLGMLGLPIGGAALAYGLARAAKETAAYHKKLSQLSIQGHISAVEQGELHKQILEVSQATGVARDDILGFTQGIVDATGNMKLGQEAMKAVAMAAQVTGADMHGLGTLVSDAFMKFGLSGKDANKTLEILIEQGEKGRWTLNEMAETAAQAMSVAGLAGMQGVEGLREMGAMMQIIRQGFGDAHSAATGFKVMVTKIYGGEAERKLKKLGVAIADPDTGKLRKFGDIFLDLLKKTGGYVPTLIDIFGTRGVMGSANFGKIMEAAGGSIEAVENELAKYRDVTGDAATLTKKFGRMSEGAGVQMEKVKANFQAMLEESILTPENLNNVAEALDNLAISAGVMGEAFKFWRE